MARKTSPFKRTGLHRLECSSCTGYTYSTVSQLETVGMPSCACGEAFTPDRLELAMLLGLEDAPVALEYFAKVASVEHGQAGPGRSLKLESRRTAAGRQLSDPSTLAAAHVERNRAAAARKRRLGALAPAVEAMPF
jgi:hypothetical protein